MFSSLGKSFEILVHIYLLLSILKKSFSYQSNTDFIHDQLELIYFYAEMTNFGL